MDIEPIILIEMRDKRIYIKEIAILLKQEMGQSLSEEECEIIDSIMKNDADFRKIASDLKSSNYLSDIDEYHINNTKSKISRGVYCKIEQIKKARRKKLNIIISSLAAAVIVFLITISLKFIKQENYNSDKQQQQITTIEAIKQHSDDIILITENGQNVKLEGSIYHISKNPKKDTSSLVEVSTTYENAISKVIVPSGKEFNIILSDGTKVWLNASSSLSFSNIFDSDERVVEIDGEGYFEVTHDPNRPFIVKNSIMNTRVLGTKFLVSAYKDNTTSSVALVEGSVEVSSCNSEYKQTLLPGKEVKYLVKSNNFSVQDIDIDNVIAKTNGLLVFENEKLIDICNYLTIFYDVSFVIMHESLKDEIFYIKTEKYKSIKMVMDLLQEASSINYNIEDNIITIF